MGFDKEMQSVFQFLDVLFEMFYFPFEVLDLLVLGCGCVGEVLPVDFEGLGGGVAGLGLRGGLYPFGYVVFEGLCQDTSTLNYPFQCLTWSSSSIFYS